MAENGMTAGGPARELWTFEQLRDRFGAREAKELASFVRFIGPDGRPYWLAADEEKMKTALERSRRELADALIEVLGRDAIVRTLAEYGWAVPGYHERLDAAALEAAKEASRTRQADRRRKKAEAAALRAQGYVPPSDAESR